MLDPDETATLEIELANRGALSTDGTVECVLSVGEGGVATATVLEADGGYGTLDIGEYRDEDDFEVQVDSGVDGDELALQLTCSDDNNTYLVQTSATSVTSPCTYTICPCNQAICRTRFDFAVRQTKYYSIPKLQLYFLRPSLLLLKQQ